MKKKDGLSYAAQFRQLYDAAEPGGAFMWTHDARTPYLQAKKMHMKIKGRNMERGGWLITKLT